jgi:hypothetical protein
MLTEEAAQITQPQNAEQLQRKIEKTVDTIIKFSEIQKQTEKSVRQQLQEIVQDADRLSISREELRRMLNEGFCSRGPRARMISESYLRRLLPNGYKYDAKTRLDYRVKQRVEEQRTTDFSKDMDKKGAVDRQPEALLGEKLDKRKEDEVWTATAILEVSGNQIPLKITVNSKERKIEHIEINREVMRNCEGF